MPRTSFKRRHREEAESSADEEVKTTKKVKTSKASNESAADAKEGKDDEGNSFWSLGATRRVVVQDFKGKTYVNIRDFYNDNGTFKPTKKGIMLNLEQYNALLAALPAVNADLQSKGHAVSGVADVASGSTPKSAKKSPSKETKSRNRKSNIEATSDEEEEDSE